jgi:DNA polymerase III sliding clamp (beta) subunit (PCNA family)
MIAIQQDVLNAALNAVTRASLTKSTLPAFSLVRLDVKTDGTLTLSCFNGETAARAVTPIACEDDLSVSVDAQTLKAVVETLTGEIQLSVEQNSLLLQNGANRTVMRCIDETVPVIGEESVQKLATLPGSALRSLARVLPFASTDSSRDVLQVMHLTFEKDFVTAQAADGYSASYVSESLQGTNEPTSVSLPVSFARLLAGLVGERDTVQVQSAGSDRYIFQITNAERTKDLTLATVTAAENFPSGQILQLIQEARRDAMAQLNLQQARLMQTLRMVNAMGTQNMFIKAASGIIKMASAETVAGQSRNIVEGTASGQDAKVWLSAAFLKRAAESCKGELTIKITGEKKPVLVETGNFTAVIMPILVESEKDPFPEEEAMAISLPELDAALMQ